MAVEWIWLIFVTAVGACVGSFLNVVIYRLPKGKSLVSPPSACPGCGQRIAFYDNIPIFSWLILRGRCRKCNTSISIRYFLVELATAAVFAGLYLWIFQWQYRQIISVVGPYHSPVTLFFGHHGWLFFAVNIALFASFLAASAIDMELWIIPLEICWFVTILGLIGSAAAGYLYDAGSIVQFDIFPAVTNAKFAAVTVGAAAGLGFSLIGLFTGLIKPSYEMAEDEEGDCEEAVQGEKQEPQYNDRAEILKEIVFLLPVIIGGWIAAYVTTMPAVAEKWDAIIAIPLVSGVLGSLGGYLIGCAVVWATRIFGTLAFGKEAMGLGDVHLMGAAGAVIGAKWVVLAFFLAPFFGILWALYQAVCKKIRQIPYGPFLSMAVFGVIIFHDWIQRFISKFYGF